MNLFKNRPLCLATAVFILFGFFCLTISLLSKIIIGASLAVVALFLLLLLKRKQVSPLAVIITSLCALQCLLSCMTADYPTRKADELGYGPHRTIAYVTSMTEYNDSFSYVIRTQTINGDACRLTFAMQCDTKLQVGDIFETDLTFRCPNPETVIEYTTPFSSGQVGDATPIGNITIRGVKTTPLIFATKCRDYLSDKLDGMFSEDAAPLLRAMLLGDRTSLSAGTALSFRRTGITHLLALSGMHIALLTFAVRRLLDVLRLPNRLKLWICILFVVLYSLLVGMPLSILRAAGMTIILLLGGLIRRERDVLSSLSAAVLIILIISPRAILDIGFWLSVTATLGILLSSESKIGRVNKTGFGYRILNLFLSSLVMTVAASLFTLPITAFIFGETSLLSIPINLIFPLLLTYIIYFALIAIPLPFLRPLVDGACSLYLRAVNSIGKIRGIMLSLTPTVFRILLFVTVLLFFLFLCIKLKRPKKMLMVIGAIFLLSIISAVIPHIISRNESRLVYSSSESYDDYILAKDNGRTVVYVSSHLSDSSSYVDLLYMLYDYGVYEVDMLYFSHHHESHSAEFLEGLSQNIIIYEVGVLSPRTEEEYDAMQAASDVCENIDCSLSVFSASDTYKIADISLTPLPATFIPDEDTKVAAVIRIAERKFYYASCGYYQSAPRYEVDPILNKLDCDTLIFGSHGNEAEREYPQMYPLNTYVATILYGLPEGYMKGTDAEGEIYETLRVLRKTSASFPCG